MILVGSQRGGASQLAAHLLNDRDNDHVTVAELRGFMAGDLKGALAEAHAIAKGTRCRQFVFSLSLNPPKDADVGVEALHEAADRAEQALGLEGQPRAIVIHEKNGRRHAHVVWSRIDASEMKAINLPHFKNRLKALSRELYLEHGWALPEGHRTNGWKNPLNFSLAEWQQAKRLDLDPREIKQAFREAWDQSDNLASFRSALEDKGFFLARGDRRGFVALDIHGEAYAVGRWAGLKPKELDQRLGSPDALPDVASARAATRHRLSGQLRAHVADDRAAKREAMQPMLDERRRMVAQHRTERARLDEGQAKRRLAETKERAARINKGLRGAWELLTGQTRVIRQQNEREAFQSFQRDRDQREQLVRAQLRERAALQGHMDALVKVQRQERMILAQRILYVLRRNDAAAHIRARPGRSHSPDMDFER